MKDKLNYFMRLLFVILTFANYPVFAQWMGGEVIDSAHVQPWIPKLTVEYQGVYHFGESESESDLYIIMAGNKIYGQIRSGTWSADGKAWLMKYQNIDDISIVGNKFLSNKYLGEFVLYAGTEKIKGLKIYNSWSGITGQGEYEIGIRTGAGQDYFAGKFPQASLSVLTKDDLTQLSKYDLKIMRNEIFARYGLTFKLGGEMDVYFRKQDWYQAQYENVDNFLTGLEEMNIRLIKEFE